MVGTACGDPAQYVPSGDVQLAYQVFGEGEHDIVLALDWIDDVTAVMDTAGSERATIVAQGRATQMALMAAATHRARIASLVLYTGFARLARNDDYPAGKPPRAQQAILDMIEATWQTGDLAYPLAPSIADRPWLTEWWGRVGALRRNASYRTGEGIGRSTSSTSGMSCRSSPRRRW